MAHTLLKATLFTIAMPVLALAQVPPTPPAAPAPKVAPTPPKVRVTPKFEYDYHYDLDARLKADLRHELDFKHDFDFKFESERLAMEVEKVAREAAHIDKEFVRDQARLASELARIDVRHQLDINRAAMEAAKVAMEPFQGGGDRLLDARPRTAWASEDPADSVYRLARESLNRGEYRRAATFFKEVTTKYPRSQYALDCLYWEAFSRYRVGTTDDLREALKILDDGKEKFVYLKQSESNMDAATLRMRVLGALASRGDRAAARTLEAETAQQSGQTCDREEINVRAEALGALAQMDLATAMPVVRKALARRDECTVELRRRALYVIGRQPNAQSIDLMLDVAKNDTDAGLRGEAMTWLGRSAGDQAVTLLEDLLKTSPDQRTQRSAVQALGAIDTDLARRAVRTIIEREDAQENVRSDAIMTLARQRDGRAMNPEDISYLRGLYAKLGSTRLKESVLSAVSRVESAENEQWLLGIARSDKEASSLRAAALQRLERMQSINLNEMVKLYDAADSRSMREAILRALSQRKEPEAVDKIVEIAKKDTDPRIRTYAIRLLTQSNNPKALQGIKELADVP